MDKEPILKELDSQAWDEVASAGTKVKLQLWSHSMPLFRVAC
jgi:hypothetical protein